MIFFKVCQNDIVDFFNMVVNIIHHCRPCSEFPLSTLHLLVFFHIHGTVQHPFYIVQVIFPMTHHHFPILLRYYPVYSFFLRRIQSSAHSSLFTSITLDITFPLWKWLIINSSFLIFPASLMTFSSFVVYESPRFNTDVGLNESSISILFNKILLLFLLI